MTTALAKDRSHESIINDTLARCLRERCSLPAVAETLHNGRRPDIIVRLSEGPVILETEFEPALTVEADALSRLGMEIDGLRVHSVFAVTVPGRIRSTSQQHMYQRMAGETLVWQEWRADGTSGPRLTGTAIELGNVVARTTPPGGNLDEAVETLDEGARRAGSRLYASPGTLGRVSKIFGSGPCEEAANMAALVVINAMVFQERLANREAAFQPVSAALTARGFSRIRLLQMWDYILSIDFYPIFSMAQEVVKELSEVEAGDVLGECARTAASLLGMGAVGRHDLAGRIFNRLISERKLLAAFYTSIPASTLLAGLALSPERWSHIDWSSPEGLSRLSVVDPACGTGTLLMAAYRQIVQNHSAATSTEADNQYLHQVLVEKVITGTDVVQAAIHLTAATLAAMSPSVRFEQMQLHTLRLGRDSSKKIWLGSLDWLEAPGTQSFFSATEEQIGATSGAGSLVQHPNADLVISNPPFTRRGSDGGKEEAIARVFSLPEGDQESRQAIAKRTSALLKGTAANQIAGHASSFTVLADRLVNPGGRIALVLPVTALFGESWREIRQMLSSRYEIEFVVSSHDPELLSMSYDTSIAEALLVARRLGEGEHPSGRGRFVNLWRAPYQETDALAMIRAVNVTASMPLLRSDGPPVGGNPLIVGGEQWGEVVDGPVGEGPWTTARWRRSLTGQIAAALKRGELWTEDGGQVTGRVPVAAMREVCNVGPQHRRIRGSLGVFDGYHGWNEQAQFPAIWKLDSSVHNSMVTDPNAWLVPQPNRDHLPIWSQSGTLHVTCDVRYNSQPVMAVRTDLRTLGVRAWHTLSVHEDDPVTRARLEIVLALWCNSTLGMLLHADHSNSAQEGRGQGNKGMLEALTTLDVRKLEAWQLDSAQAIWRDFNGQKFQPFYQCATDPVRIDLDARVVGDLLGLSQDAVAAIATLRTILANDPSIHGSKKPELPARVRGRGGSPN